MTLCVGARISADLIAITNETELFGEPAHAFRRGGGSVANFRSKLSLVRRRRRRQCAPNGTGKRGSKMKTSAAQSASSAIVIAIIAVYFDI